MNRWTALNIISFQWRKHINILQNNENYWKLIDLSTCCTRARGDDDGSRDVKMMSKSMTKPMYKSCQNYRQNDCRERLFRRPCSKENEFSLKHICFRLGRGLRNKRSRGKMKKIMMSKSMSKSCKVRCQNDAKKIPSIISALQIWSRPPPTISKWI